MPVILIGKIWICFCITNFLTNPNEYIFISITHLIMYFLGWNYPETGLSYFISTYPGIISLITVIEYEINRLFKKKTKIFSYSVSVAAIYSALMLIASFIIVLFNTIIIDELPSIPTVNDIN